VQCPVPDPLPGCRTASAVPGEPHRELRSNPVMPQSWPLLGRETELAYLTEALAGGQAGVVLAGAAGVARPVWHARPSLGPRDKGPRPVGSRQPGTRIHPLRFVRSPPSRKPSSHDQQAASLSRIAEEALEPRSRGPSCDRHRRSHCSDDASAALTHQLASNSGIFVLATTRTGDPAPDSDHGALEGRAGRAPRGAGALEGPGWVS